MIAEYIIVVLVYLILVYEIHQHNQKVEKEWPDHTDPEHFRMREKFSVPMYGPIFFLLLLIGVFVKDLLS